MVAVHGSNADVISNGYLLSTFFNSAGSAGNRDNAETTCFKQGSKSYIPGLKDSTVTCEGIFDGDPETADEILWAAIGEPGSGLMSYFPAGADNFGDMGYNIDSAESSYEISTEVGDVAQISAEFSMGEVGLYDRGYLAHPLAVESASGSTTVQDNTAATTNGGSLVVHATTATNLSVQLQDSADGTTFADIDGALTVASGRSSQRLTFTGNLRQYTRVNWSGTGTFLIVVCRH